MCSYDQNFKAVLMNYLATWGTVEQTINAIVKQLSINAPSRHGTTLAFVWSHVSDELKDDKMFRGAEGNCKFGYFSMGFYTPFHITHSSLANCYINI